MNALDLGYDAASVSQPINPAIALIAAKGGAPIFIGIWISYVVLARSSLGSKRLTDRNGARPTAGSATGRSASSSPTTSLRCEQTR